MISIIIPVYNQADKITACLDSIKNQTYENFEIIVINDGSTDNVLEVLPAYENFFSYKFRTFTQENKGANAARNYGSSVARGEFLLFCDADLTMEPDMLITMLNTLKQNPQSSYAYAAHKFGWKTFHLWAFDADRLRRMPYIHTTSLIRKEHFPGFDENIKRFQDWDLWLTMLEQGHTGIWIEKILFEYAPGGTMSTWLPSFAFKILPFLPQVKKYNNAMAVIKNKHKLNV